MCNTAAISRCALHTSAVLLPVSCFPVLSASSPTTSFPLHSAPQLPALSRTAVASSWCYHFKYCHTVPFSLAIINTLLSVAMSSLGEQQLAFWLVSLLPVTFFLQTVLPCCYQSTALITEMPLLIHFTIHYSHSIHNLINWSQSALKTLYSSSLWYQNVLYPFLVLFV